MCPMKTIGANLVISSTYVLFRHPVLEKRETLSRDVKAVFVSSTSIHDEVQSGASFGFLGPIWQGSGSSKNSSSSDSFSRVASLVELKPF